MELEDIDPVVFIINDTLSQRVGHIAAFLDAERYDYPDGLDTEGIVKVARVSLLKWHRRLLAKSDLPVFPILHFVGIVEIKVTVDQTRAAIIPKLLPHSDFADLEWSIDCATPSYRPGRKIISSRSRYKSWQPLY